MNKPRQRMLVLGNGSWGTALALVLQRNGHQVSLWGRNEARMQDLAKTRQSENYLVGIRLPESIDVCWGKPNGRDFDHALVAVPTQFIRPCLMGLFTTDTAPEHLIVVSKGIEKNTSLMSMDIVRDVLPGARVAGLFGPSHAEEVAKLLPATLVSVAKDLDHALEVQELFMNEAFRVYANTDVIGVQLGAALKNVVGLAAGVCDGMALGDNAKSALLVRGLHEISVLGAAMGAQPETFAGISGMGDLITTCFSSFGRNLSVGVKIGQGQSIDEILAGMSQVAEGVPTTKATFSLAKKMKVEMPIVEALHAVLFDGKNPRKALTELMLRDPRCE